MFDPLGRIVWDAYAWLGSRTGAASRLLRPLPLDTHHVLTENGQRSRIWRGCAERWAHPVRAVQHGHVVHLLAVQHQQLAVLGQAPAPVQYRTPQCTALGAGGARATAPILDTNHYMHLKEKSIDESITETPSLIVHSNTFITQS